MKCAILGAILVGLLLHPASAATIAVSPVSLDVITEAGAATSVTVTNAGSSPVDVQSRVERWTSVGGRDQLEPTAAVVLSPGIVRIEPGQDQTVRVIRVSRDPVQGEESYRVLIDQLPSSPRGTRNAVSLIVRQSLPLFFRAPDSQTAPLSFMVSHVAAKPMLIAVNVGSVHQKLTDLLVESPGGRILLSRPGLAGYVLGHATFAWPLPPGSLGPAIVRARTESGNINVPAARR